jgi:PII-like signaling protein
MLISTKTITIEVFDSDEKVTYLVRVVDNTIKHLTVKFEDTSPMPMSFKALPLEVQSEIIAHL